MRNILYRASLAYILAFPVVVFLVSGLLPMVLPADTSALEAIFSVLFNVVALMGYLLPAALICIVVGKSPSAEGAVAGVPAPKSNAGKWFRIAAGVSIVVAVVPFVATRLWCFGSAPAEGCGAYMLMVGPLLTVALPVFLISIIALLILEMRGK